MKKVLEKLALGAAFSAALGSSQAADLPVHICTLNPTKSVARIYELTDAGNYQFSEKSGRLVRSRGFVENVTAALNKFRDSPSPVPPSKVAEGFKGEYTGPAFMYLVNERRVVEKYKAAVQVSVKGWDGSTAHGECEILSEVDGETRLKAPIVPEHKYSLREPGHF